MVKQTIAKEEAERRISQKLRHSHPDAGGVSLSQVDERWTCDLDGHDMHGAVAADADALLAELLRDNDISQMPSQSVPVDELNTGNDK